MKNIIKILLLSSTCVLLNACNALLDKDNTPKPSPLVNFKQEINIRQAWNTHTNWGTDSDYLKLVPAITDSYIFTASSNGNVTATNKSNGSTVWNVNTGSDISAGPAASENLVFIGHRNGDVSALDQTNGNQVWRVTVSSEILATPVASRGILLVKAIDGRIHALSVRDGHTLWNYQQAEPTLILRKSSTPLIDGNIVVAGFANGNLSKLTLDEGSLLWQQTVAAPQGVFAIQRMVDIDSDPIVYNHKIYAATFQGRIASLDFTTGNTTWTHDISSYTGIAADSEKVYVSDAKSHLWAFNAANGSVIWRQTELEARNISGPVIMGNYLVVGDGEGYLHWLSRQDGHFVARTQVQSSSILAAPVIDHNTLYVVTREGYLASYTIS